MKPAIYLLGIGKVNKKIMASKTIGRTKLFFKGQCLGRGFGVINQISFSGKIKSSIACVSSQIMLFIKEIYAALTI